MGDAPATRPSLLVRIRDPRDEPAWAQFVDYDPERDSFRGWLFTVVRNRLRNFLASQQRRTKTGAVQDQLQTMEQLKAK